MPALTRQSLDVGGLRAAHLIVGAGDIPVVALHGWGASADLISPLAQQLAAQGIRLYIPDLPGFGQTPAPPAAWGVHDYATFVLAYMDAVGLRRANLFGHSFGGRIALVLGADHAQRVSKIALANSAGVPPRRSLWSQLRLASYKRVRDLLYDLGARSFADRLRTWYSARYGSADYRSAGPLRETFVRVVNEDLLPVARRISAPTLLIWGGRDEDTPVWQARALESAIADCGLVIYKDAGHYSYLDKLGEVARTLAYFYRH